MLLKTAMILLSTYSGRYGQGMEYARTKRPLSFLSSPEEVMMNKQIHTGNDYGSHFMIQEKGVKSAKIERLSKPSLLLPLI